MPSSSIVYLLFVLRAAQCFEVASWSLAAAAQIFPEWLWSPPTPRDFGRYAAKRGRYAAFRGGEGPLRGQLGPYRSRSLTPSFATWGAGREREVEKRGRARAPASSARNEGLRG